MDQTSPGIPGNSSTQVSTGSHSRQNAVHSKPQLQGQASSSANPPSNQGLAVRPTDPSTLLDQGTAHSAVNPALYGQGPGSTPHRDTCLGCPGHPLQDKPSQRFTTHSSISQAPSQPGQNCAKHRNVFDQAASRPSRREEGRQMRLDGVYRHNEVSLEEGHEEGDRPDWSALGHEYDRHELFIFGNDGSCNTEPDGSDPKVLNRDTRAEVPDRVLLGENSFQSEETKLSSARERVPTPGLSRILGPAPNNKPIQHRSIKPNTLQGHNPSATGYGARPREKTTQYYDYSEGFENSTTSSLHMSTGRIHVPDQGSVEPYYVERHQRGDRGNFYPAETQASYGYSQVHTRDGGFPYGDAAPGYAFSNPSLQGGFQWTGQSQREYVLQGELAHPMYPQHPQVPLREYYAEPYGAYPGAPHGPILPHQSRNREHHTRVYPYSQSYQGRHHGASVCYRGRGDARRYAGVGLSTSRKHGQYRDSGQGGSRRFCDAEKYHPSREVFKGHYSNEENMPPELQSQGYYGSRHGATQTHRRAQNMMKSLIPRGLGQDNGPNDGPVIRISQPIPILAPRPVSSNVGLRLAENVLSIDDDDMLPAALRNLHDRSSGPSDDELPDFGPTHLGQTGPFLGPNINLNLQFQVPRKAPVPGKNEARRPRLIARVDSTKAPASNAQIYAPPKNVDFRETVGSRPRIPYPADTLTELEYRGVIRTRPKADSDAGSRSITKPDHDRWQSAKAMFESAKEDVMAKLGIKTKRVREAEKLGYTPLTRHAKASIPSSGPQDDAFDKEHEMRKLQIEQWRLRTSNENDVVEGPRTDAENLRVLDANGHRPNMTTAAGHAIACPSIKERLMHLKAKAFRSKPNLRENM